MSFVTLGRMAARKNKANSDDACSKRPRIRASWGKFQNSPHRSERALGIRDQGSGIRVQGSGFGVRGSGFGRTTNCRSAVLLSALCSPLSALCPSTNNLTMGRPPASSVILGLSVAFAKPRSFSRRRQVLPKATSCLRPLRLCPNQLRRRAALGQPSAISERQASIASAESAFCGWRRFELSNSRKGARRQLAGASYRKLVPSACQLAPPPRVHLYHRAGRCLAPIFGHWFSPWPERSGPRRYSPWPSDRPETVRLAPRDDWFSPWPERSGPRRYSPWPSDRPETVRLAPRDDWFSPWPERSGPRRYGSRHETTSGLGGRLFGCPKSLGGQELTNCPTVVWRREGWLTSNSDNARNRRAIRRSAVFADACVRRWPAIRCCHDRSSVVK
jgi:hypothetical protein